MNKTFLATALALGLCVPTYAAQYTNSDSDRYTAPVFGDELEEQQAMNEPVRDRKSKKEADQEAAEPLPITMTADHAEYDSVSGDFHASGNVKLVQGMETLLTTYAYGNMKTGDVWLVQGGTLVEPSTRMTGQWVHYNFNTKTGAITQIDGKSNKDLFSAPHAEIRPEMIFVDQGGSMSRCPAVHHPKCFMIRAKTFEIYPRDKMIARDVQVFVRGKHIYSRDLWVNSMDEANKTKIRPKVGYDGHDNGWYGGVEITHPITEKTNANFDLTKYSRAGYKPVYGVDHDERNFHISYSNGWDEDDDTWYKKQNNWRFDYKNHHIIDGLPLSYSGYLEYGLWKRENSRYRSWHKEYAVYLNHDPIYLFNSKNTVLNLTLGRKWVHESYTDELRKTDMYYATLGQKLTDKWRIWTGYYQEDQTSNLFDIGQPDMEKEMRYGVQFVPDTKNVFSIVNRFDVGKGNQYETDFRWLHKFCCWQLEVTYEREQETGDNSFKVKYYFDI